MPFTLYQNIDNIRFNVKNIKHILYRKTSYWFQKPEYPYTLYVYHVGLNGPDTIGMNTEEECIKIIEEIEEKKEFLQKRQEKKYKRYEEEYLEYKKLNLD